MPLRTVKNDMPEALTLEWVLHIKNYKLALDKKRCAGCEICRLACPKEAIEIRKQPKTDGEKTRKPKVDIDLKKCNFCGICDILCPYGAIEVTIDGKHILSVLEKESFPQLIREILVDESKIPLDRDKVEGVCPLKLIKVSFTRPDGEPDDTSKIKTNVSIEQDFCPCCGVCEVKLPEGAIHLHKFISGKLVIHEEKCPDGCRDCLDVCPITGALYVSDDDSKVHVNEAFCVYCGACKIVCPVEEALELKRTRIKHTPIKSGAWNKALERLTSTTEMTKELKTKGSARARESVKRRVALRGEQHA